MEIRGCELVQTCGACPEQYDVMLGDTYLGYLRLRHGHFTARYGGSSGPIVYEAEPDGDGIFEDNERVFFLANAIDALLAFTGNI